jgi:hypothetical protein
MWLVSESDEVSLGLYRRQRWECIAVSPEARPKMKQFVEFFELQANNS